MKEGALYRIKRKGLLYFDEAPNNSILVRKEWIYEFEMLDFTEPLKTGKIMLYLGLNPRNSIYKDPKLFLMDGKVHQCVNDMSDHLEKI